MLSPRGRSGPGSPAAARAPASGRVSTELSPSRRGVRSFVEGVLPAGCRNRVGDIEAYSAGRFLTITGDTLPDRPLAVTDAAGGLAWLVAEHLTPRKAKAP